MSTRTDQLGRLAVLLVVGIVGVVLGWFLFLVLPGTLADLLGVLLTIAVGIAAIRLGGRIAVAQFPDYNVAQVSVEGPISRDGGGSPIPRGPSAPTADDLVEQIELADEDDASEALLLELNTPGGEVLPSDDIRRAAAEFDGPTVAFARDTCASGGYWIASGCDELWAQEASLVGSIGVLGSRPNAAGLAEKLGITYEQLTAGEYKEAGTPLKEMSEDEREYLQGLIDGYYDQFVETVAEGREMDPETIRETEAKVYLGTEAQEVGLVDELGTREDVLDHIEETVGEEATVREFEPQRGVMERLSFGARRVAFAAGAGVASRFSTDDGLDVDFRL